MGQFPLTLSRFIIQKQAAHPGATGELSSLLSQIGLVGKFIAQDLRRAGRINILGTTGEMNVQGETVKKLDEIANQTFKADDNRESLHVNRETREMRPSF
jgi:fructose-1,6-bisphosphatase I